MTALQILAAWFATSPIAGLLIARCIPPSTPHDRAHQSGEGNGAVGGDLSHSGSNPTTRVQHHA